MIKNNFNKGFIFFAFVSSLVLSCSPVIQRTVSPLDNSELLTMTRRYYSLENQFSYFYSGKYKMQIQWIRHLSEDYPLEAIFSLVENTIGLSDFQDTLIISASAHLMKFPMTHYNSAIQTRRTEETVTEYKLHQGRILIEPQQQQLIVSADTVYILWNKDFSTISFRLQEYEKSALEEFLEYR